MWKGPQKTCHFTSWSQTLVKKVKNLSGNKIWPSIYLLGKYFHWDYLSTPLTVYCDQDTAGGGWLVIMKQPHDNVYVHDRHWEDYKLGFCDLTTIIWLGFENINHLTYNKSMILHTEIPDCVDNSCHTKSTSF